MDAPRLAVYVARVQLAVVAALALLGLAGGVAMQLELWEPGPAWSLEHYTRMLELHSVLALAVGAPVLAGSFGYLAVAELVGAKRVPAPAVAWLGLGLWGIGVAASALAMAGARADDSGWTLYTPTSVVAEPTRWVRQLGAIALASSGLVFALHLGALVAGAWRGAAAGKRAVAIALVGALAGAAVGALVQAGARVITAPYILGATAVAASLLAGAALALRARDWPVRAFVVLGVAPAFVLYAMTRWNFGPSDLHVHDTYFAVGGSHAVAALIAFALLAAGHAWGAPLLGRTPHAALASVGAAACGAGVVLSLSAELRVGLAGMPRRYWQYDPEFTSSHQLAGIGAAIVCTALVVLAVAWATGRGASRT